MMKKLDQSRWKLSLAGFTVFLLATLIYSIIGPNIPGVLGFLTAAIILFIINVIYVFYTNRKSKRPEADAD